MSASTTEIKPKRNPYALHQPKEPPPLVELPDGCRISANYAPNVHGQCNSQWGGVYNSPFALKPKPQITALQPSEARDVLRDHLKAISAQQAKYDAAQAKLAAVHADASAEPAALARIEALNRSEADVLMAGGQPDPTRRTELLAELELARSIAGPAKHMIGPAEQEAAAIYEDLTELQGRTQSLVDQVLLADLKQLSDKMKTYARVVADCEEAARGIRDSLFRSSPHAAEHTSDWFSVFDDKQRRLRIRSRWFNLSDRLREDADATVSATDA